MRSISDFGVLILLATIALAAFFPRTVHPYDLYYRIAIAVGGGALSLSIIARIGSGAYWVRLIAAAAFGLVVFAVHPLRWFPIFDEPGINVVINLEVGNDPLEPSATARAALVAAVEALQVKGDRPATAPLMTKLAELEARIGRLQDAAEAYQEALAIFSWEEDLEGKVTILLSQANTERRAGDTKESREIVERVRSMIEVFRDAAWSGKVDLADGLAALEEGEDEAATKLLRAALATAAKIEDKKTHSRAAAGLGEIDLRAGQHNQALVRFNEALALAKKANDPQAEAVARLGLARTHLALGETSEARRHLDQAKDLYERMEDPYGQAAVNVTIGDMARRNGQPDAARRAYSSAIDLYRSGGNDTGVASCEFELGDLLRTSNPAAAREYFQSAAYHFGVPRTLYGRRMAEAAAARLVEVGPEN